MEYDLLDRLDREQQLQNIIGAMDLVVAGAFTSPEYQAIGSFMDQQGLSFRQTVDETFLARLQEPFVGQSVTERFDLLVESLREIGGSQVQARLGSAIDAVRQQLVPTTMMERAAGWLANDLLQQTKDELNATINWERAIGRLLAGYDTEVYPYLAELNGTRMTLPYQQAILEIESFHSWREHFAGQGDLLPEGQRWQAPEGWQPNLYLPAEILEWARSTTDITTRYFSSERLQLARQAFPNIELGELVELSYSAGMAAQLEGQPMSVPAPIAHALERHARTYMEGFDRVDAEALQRALNEPAPSISIGNAELFTAATGIEDVQGWLGQRLARLPQHLTHGLSEVNFTRGLGSLRNSHGEEIQRGAILRRDTAIEIDLEAIIETVEGEQAEPYGLLVLDRTQRVFDHEAAHHMHLNRLSKEWLENWQRIVDTDNVTIPTVERLRDTDFVDAEGRRYEPNREALAHSVELYMNAPWTFVTEFGAVERFMALNELLGRYSPDLVQHALSTMKQPGYDPDSALMQDALFSDNSVLLKWLLSPPNRPEQDEPDA